MCQEEIILIFSKPFQTVGLALHSSLRVWSPRGKFTLVFFEVGNMVLNMIIKFLPMMAAVVLPLAVQSLAVAELETDFVSMFDGKSFDGWKKAEEHQDTWKIENGALVAHGDRCHLFYVGDSK